MQPQTLAQALGGIARIPAFFVWRLTWNSTKGKFEKLPVGRDGGAIDAQLPVNWQSLEAASAQLAQMRATDTAEVRHALGWMFTQGAGYWFLDIDGCVKDGQYSPLALDWIALFPGCFFEVSSGGTGIHIIGRGQVPQHSMRNKKCGAEFYTSQRGICFGLTDTAWGSADTVAPGVAAFVAQYFPPRAEGEAGEWDKPRADWRGPADDAELLQRARASASVAAKLGNRATFEQLWTNAPELDNFYVPDSASERDAALAAHLAFWTGCDAPRIERLMRQSALRRSKWDEHRTYLRELTIEGACAQQVEVLQDRPRVDVVKQMYGVALLPLPEVPGAAPVVVPVVDPVMAAKVEELLDMVSSSADWVDIHNRVIPAIRAAGIPPALMPRVENAVNKRLDLFDGKMPVAKLRALLNPPREAGAASDDADGLMLKPEWADHYVYVQQLDAFYDLRDGSTVTRTTFGALHDRHMPIKGDGPDRHEAAKFMLQHWGTNVVFDTMYYPGKPPVFEYEGQQWANTYTPSAVPAVADGYTPEGVAAIGSFQRHLWLLCDQREKVYLTLLAWMAHNVQRPGVKIRWVPIIKGIQGDGKSTIGMVMKAAIGARNFMTVGPEIICNGGGFTDWAHGHAVLALEELHITGKERHKTANMLKQFISNNDATIHPKGGKPKPVLNTCNQIAYTNYSDAIPLDAAHDRRWLVIFSPFSSREQMCAALGVAYDRLHFDPLYDSLRDHAGQWRKWLLDMPIPEWFAPDSAPIHTEEKQTMADSSVDDVEMLARDLIREGTYGVSANCLSSACLSRALRQSAFSEGVELPKTTSLHHMLNRMGFVRAAANVKWDGATHRVWVGPAISAKLNNEELRQLLELTKKASDLQPNLQPNL